ncbi:MAG: glycosyltransferase family 2 protein [Candidatus Pacebacteria bacterium]|jgi:rhamnosyltransferase|nr:glycosyltransferase family 2 protein [Candidatus Paceibacterota bacterium]MBT4004751.1 glycosyltransferase family 2 protein [Candidatus Paceibacterota bacterium]MBT6899258.1 glycosyltransferase family 2 protein [Candidatus Paceibacterota bacterium]MBT7184158.1 glycosyltransferase family 2 protein [Candidatus Paceibacterota bacterium]MBT7310010.1 glycosyltransferase family 2 protein [Candidatus Paceibacterota bacterium]
MNDKIFPKHPKTSFIIRTFNEQKWLPTLLQSLFSQSRLDFEIIIVDSGSTDKTLEVIQQFPIRKIIKISKKSFNYAYALNLGINSSWGEMIGIISGHSIPVSRTWYEDGLSNFSYKKIAAITGYTMPLPDASYDERLQSLHIGSLFTYFDKNTKFMSNTNAIIRRSLWEKYPFDERITKGIKKYDYATEGCEDYDWAQEMISRGFRIVKDPNFNVYHSHGGLNRDKYSQRIDRWNKICSLIDQKKRPSSSSYTEIKLITKNSQCSPKKIKSRVKYFLKQLI